MGKTPLLSIIMTTYNQEVLAIRALDSIPRRDDIEVIISDDCSTDGTWANILRYCNTHPELNIRAYRNKKNLSCYINGNKALGYATGEYIHSLDNDDYLFTDEYSKAMDQFNGEDCVYIDLQINDGTILHLSEESRHLFCAPITKFVRREFAKGITFPEEIKGGADWQYNEELLARNPVSKYTGIVAYAYNYPRAGSVSDLFIKGLL